MIICLGTDFWVWLCCLGVLFFGSCFLSGFSESVMAVCCLFYLPAQLVCSQGMPASVGSWDVSQAAFSLHCVELSMFVVPAVKPDITGPKQAFHHWAIALASILMFFKIIYSSIICAVQLEIHCHSWDQTSKSCPKLWSPKRTLVAISRELEASEKSSASPGLSFPIIEKRSRPLLTC